jgi:glyoxylase-like metal-dependent hydrolase (beta-lactamase superfamily II)
VRDFKVTRWLHDGDVIHLDDEDKGNPSKVLQVLFTPGHTLDSISLFHYGERRLFLADLLCVDSLMLPSCVCVCVLMATYVCVRVCIVVVFVVLSSCVCQGV